MNCNICKAEFDEITYLLFHKIIKHGRTIQTIQKKS